MAQFLPTRFGRIPDLECFGKIRRHIVRGSCLKRLAVTHHCLDGEGSYCSGESLTRRLLSWYDWQGSDVAGDFGIQVQREHCLCYGSCFVCMRGVTLLPE